MARRRNTALMPALAVLAATHLSGCVTRSTYDSMLQQQQTLEAALSAEILADQVKIEQLENGVRVQMADGLLYRSGAVELQPQGRAALDKVAAQLAGMAAQVASIAGDALEAGNPANSPAMQAAMGLSASVAAAQMANDLVAMAMGALMGKDPCVPPGTPGAITLNVSSNVLIGGFPMPSWMAIAKGLLKLIKGLSGRGKGGGGRPSRG